MSIHYPKGLIGQCRAAGLVPVAIEPVAGLSFIGGVTPDEQMELLALMQRFQKNHPVGDLPPIKRREGKEGEAKKEPVAAANGTPVKTDNKPPVAPAAHVKK